MARRIEEFDPTTPYHLSSRCINKDWFEIPMQEVWELMNHQLYLTKHFFNLKIYSFVLMSNHYHMIAQGPDDNMSEGMAYFLRETSRDLTKTSHRINQTWGGRFFRSRLGCYHYFMNTYKYIYQNPIRAGICKHVEEYQFGTLNGLLGFSRLEIPLEYDAVLFDNSTEQILKWLNQPSSLSNYEAMRKALRRGNFKLPRDGRKSNPHPLETQLL